MIISPLKNFGTFGCEIKDISYPFVKSEIQEIRDRVKSELVVVLPQANISKEQFYELCGLVGTINQENLVEGQELDNFAGYYSEGNKVTMPGLNKVTGKRKKDGRYEGLAPGVARILNWHCAEHNRKDAQGNPTPEPEMVALQAVAGTEGTITQVCQMIDRYQQEPNKDELDKMMMNWSFVFDDEKETANVDVEEEYFPANESIEDMNKINPLVKKCYNGHKGLHYSPAQVSGIVGKSHEEFLKFKEYVTNNYIIDDYIHDQIWQNGDIMFFDQTVCIHRRVDKDRQVAGLTAKQLANRLLHRIEIYLNK